MRGFTTKQCCYCFLRVALCRVRSASGICSKFRGLQTRNIYAGENPKRLLISRLHSNPVKPNRLVVLPFVTPQKCALLRRLIQVARRSFRRRRTFQRAKVHGVATCITEASIKGLSENILGLWLYLGISKRKLPQPPRS